MKINVLLCYLIALTIATIPSTTEKLTHLSACTKGRITHYSGFESGGSCSFGEVASKVTEGYMFTAALSEAFYDGSNKCGICYEIVGPDASIRVMANNLCPASDTNGFCDGDMIHFDLAENAQPYLFDSDYGNVNGNVTFRMVACDLDGNIKIKEGSSNDYYFPFVVMNHVIGLKGASYSIDEGVTYTELERGSSNWFAIGSDTPIPTPLKIKITSITDEELVIDIDSIGSETIIDSGVQFKIPDDEYFNIETLETTTKPDDIDECCDQPDDVDTVYTDDLQGIWIAQSSNCNYTLDSTVDPYKGSNCIRANFDEWGIFQFWGNYAVKANLYTNVSFYVKCDSVCDDCFLITATFATTKRIAIDKADTWQYVSLTLDEILDGDTTQSLNFQNYATDTRTCYFDEVRWIHSEVDSSICADKYLSNGIRISIISIVLIFIILI